MLQIGFTVHTWLLDLVEISCAKTILKEKENGWFWALCLVFRNEVNMISGDV